MKQHLTNFIQALGGIKMRDDSFARVRASLSSYADLHSMPERAASPQVVSFLAFVSSRNTRYVSAFALVLVVAGGGTIGAAERALPGDVLYAVKVEVSERARAAFANTPEERAELATSLAGRRADEAVVLIEKGAFDADTAAYLEAEVARQVEASDSAAVALESEGNVAASLKARGALADALADRVAALAPEEDMNAGAALMMEAADAPVSAKMQVMSFEAAPPMDPQASFTEQLRQRAESVAAARTETAAAFLPGIASSTIDLTALNADAEASLMVTEEAATSTENVAPQGNAWPTETRALWLPE